MTPNRWVCRIVRADAVRERAWRRTPAMIEPIAGVPSTAAIVVVAADELDLQRLVARLERRYGTEYNVVGLGSGADAIARLSNLRDTGREVAIVLADYRL